MIRLLIILFYLNIGNCSDSLLVNSENSCQTTNFDTLELRVLGEMLLGNWHYEYSFYKDSCFPISDLGDLSSKYRFEKSDTNLIKSEFPKLYSFGRNKLLFGLISTHEDKQGEKKTYPMVNSVGTIDNQTCASVTHYIMGNGVGKSDTYYLESVNSDTLVIRNMRYYDIGNRKLAGVNHVYLKQG